MLGDAYVTQINLSGDGGQLAAAAPEAAVDVARADVTAVLAQIRESVSSNDMQYEDGTSSLNPCSALESGPAEHWRARLGGGAAGPSDDADLIVAPPGRSRGSAQAIRLLVSREISSVLQPVGLDSHKIGPAVVVYGSDSGRPILAMVSGWSFNVKRTSKSQPVRLRSFWRNEFNRRT